jgi:hypothetical protein
MPIPLVPARLAASAAVGVLITAVGYAAAAPAAAGSLIHQIAGLVTCSTGAPCVSWQNNGSGPAIKGIAASTAGVAGYTSGAANSGVYGESDSAAGGYGVHGGSAAANGVGVYGAGKAGIGVLATASGANPALSAKGTGGHGADLSSSTGVGAVLANGANASNGVGYVLADPGSTGAIIGGLVNGAIITSGQFGNPLSVYGFNNGGFGHVSGYFLVDSTGNVNYSGSLIGPSATRTGALVTTFVTKTTQSNIEDSGTAQLINGAAVVRLDPAYAQSIDMQTPYRVFLTPDADSRGLYIAQKTPTSFTVREMQGGRGTFAFDYRILGSALGHTADRMGVMNPAAVARLVHPLK